MMRCQATERRIASNWIIGQADLRAPRSWRGAAPVASALLL